MNKITLNKYSNLSSSGINYSHNDFLEIEKTAFSIIDKLEVQEDNSFKTKSLINEKRKHPQNHIDDIFEKEYSNSHFIDSDLLKNINLSFRAENKSINIEGSTQSPKKNFINKNNNELTFEKKILKVGEGITSFEKTPINIKIIPDYFKIDNAIFSEEMKIFEEKEIVDFTNQSKFDKQLETDEELLSPIKNDEAMIKSIHILKNIQPHNYLEKRQSNTNKSK